MVSLFGDGDDSTPRPASILTPAHHYPVIAPDRKYRAPGGHHHIGIALVIEQSLCLENWFPDESFQAVTDFYRQAACQKENRA